MVDTAAESDSSSEMETRFIVPPPPAPTVGLFRLFTKESLTKIERRIQEERSAKRPQDAEGTGAPATTTSHDDKDDGPEPNPLLEAGSKLPAKMAGEFPAELYGKPIEDLDDFYQNKHVSVHNLFQQQLTSTTLKSKVFRESHGHVASISVRVAHDR